MKILLIDNYDSFTYNLYHYLSALKTKVQVYRNDKINSSEIIKKRFDRIVISPGPGNPNQSGNCLKIVKEFHKKIDLLYLDSFDGHDVELASVHQFNEAKAVIDKLKDSSLILLDDKGAKTLYSKDYFVNHDFKVLAETENQLLLSKIL